MPIGGGKGGSDFDPKGRSDAEVMRFCQMLHDRAVPPPRRVHRRARRRHRRRAPRDRLPVRPVQAHHQPLRVRRPDRQGRSTGAARSCAREATGYGARLSSSRRCCDAAASRSTARRASSPAPATSRSTPSRRSQQLGGTVVACSDSDGYVVDDEGHRPRRCSSRSRRSSAAASHDYAERATARRAFVDRRRASGTCRATSRCRRATQNELDRPRRRGARRERRASRSPRAPTCRRPRGAVARLPGGRRRLRPGQGGQRRRRRHQRARDAAERLARLLVLRAHRGAARGDHPRHPHRCAETAEEFGAPGDYVVGANIAGFMRVADAMLAFGLV